MNNSLKDIESFWAKVCFDPAYEPEGRFRTYRELVFEGMMDVLKNICPVAHSILKESEWRHVFWEFLKEAPPKSAILRQLPYEFSQFLKDASHSLSSKYPYLGELMEYECLEIFVRDAPDKTPSQKHGTISLNSAHALGQYRWPVHFISEEFFQPESLPQGDYFLFLWRHPETFEVKFMEVNSLVASIFHQLEAQDMEAVELLDQIAQKHQIAKSLEYEKEGLLLLKQLKEDGILIQN